MEGYETGKDEIGNNKTRMGGKENDEAGNNESENDETGKGERWKG